MLQFLPCFLINLRYQGLQDHQVDQIFSSMSSSHPSIILFHVLIEMDYTNDTMTPVCLIKVSCLTLMEDLT